MSTSHSSTSRSTRRVPRALRLPVLASGLAGACLADADPDAAIQGSQTATHSSADPTDERTAAEDIGDTSGSPLFEYRSLDGSGNDLDDPTLGQANSIYTRVTEANCLRQLR